MLDWRLPAAWREIRGEVRFHETMRAHTSFRLGGPADVLAFPRDTGDLQQVLALARQERIPLFVLGRGTNLLVGDSGFRGLVVSLKEGFREVEILQEEGGHCQLRCGAGVRLASLIGYSLREGLSGLEFAVGIPGSVGGAVVMNAGLKKQTIGQLVDWVLLMDRQGQVSRIEGAKLCFAYRCCHLPPGSIVLSVALALQRSTPQDVRRNTRDVFFQKRSVQPVTAWSAGCIFKNPSQDSAGRLIESVGLKGYRLGGSRVSEMHANFIVNEGQATTSDVLQLISLIQKKVYLVKGIWLEKEVETLLEEG